MDNTKIQWTDATWNTLLGCSRISPGCQNCYAETMSARFSGEHEYYNGVATRTPAGGRWTGNVRFNEEKLLQPLKWQRARRIFVNSMSDTFHAEVSDEWLDKMFAIMVLSPRHTFQVLTKRAQRMRDYLNNGAVRFRIAEQILHYAGVHYKLEPFDYLLAHQRLDAKLPGYIMETDSGKYYLNIWPLPNIWLGVSVENQQTADKRIPLLLHTPAAMRWLSCEPLLEPVTLQDAMPCGYYCDEQRGHIDHELRGLDWVVAGGESGPGARPCNIQWLRSLVGECDNANIAVFVKQLGRYPVLRLLPDGTRANLKLTHHKGGDINEWPADLQRREFPQ